MISHDNKPSAFVTKVSSSQFDFVSLAGPSFVRHYVTGHVKNSDRPFEMFQELSEFIAQKKANIISQYIFGGCRFYEHGMKALKEACNTVDWPVTWIQGDGCSGENITATQLVAMEAADVRPIAYHGRVVGFFYEDQAASYCHLSNLLPEDASVSRSAQSRAVFEMMQEILGLVGMDFKHVIRTWLYLNDLLNWYDVFNQVRTAFFNERGVFGGVVPASTGIGAGNAFGAALVSDLIAVKPKTDRVKIEAIASPLQCPAIDYKSSFSRAVEVGLDDYRTLYISGTASINKAGKTVHLDDCEKQIALTMEVAAAILQSRKMDWSDMVRGIAYFKDMKDLPLFQKYCRENRLPHLPLALSHSDICRHDLLFEIELDAIKTGAFS
jgi:enamine deaminase RidA (YjgF/YER057c/UK114 family)